MNANTLFNKIVRLMEEDWGVDMQESANKQRKAAVAAIDAGVARGWKPMKLTPGLNEEYDNDMTVLAIGEYDDQQLVVKTWKLQKLFKALSEVFDPTPTKTELKRSLEETRNKQNPTLLKMLKRTLSGYGLNCSILEGQSGKLRVVVKRPANDGSDYTKENFLVSFCEFLERLGCKFTSKPTDTIHFGRFKDGQGNSYNIGWEPKSGAPMKDLCIFLM